MKTSFAFPCAGLALLVASFQFGCPAAAAAEKPAPLAAGVRGVATRAPKDMKIDGDLSEFKDAFCTPVEYFNWDFKNRSAQFFYMWDDENFYAALRTLDTKQANNAGNDHLWEGDGVEWYFDPRSGNDMRGLDWGPGSIHCYWSAFTGTNLQPRFTVRQDTPYHGDKQAGGVEVAARRTSVGVDLEFKMPWTNFPSFKAKLNAVLALDAEACYSDGEGRTFRSFVYGSPLSVWQPTSFAKIQLVDKLEPKYWPACAPVLAPVRCDVPWEQKERAMVTGYMALPPNLNGEIGKVVFRLLGLDGSKLGDFPGKIEVFEAQGNFRRAKAQWSYDLAPAGTYELVGIIYDKSGKELGRVAPRMVSVNFNRGY